MGLAEHLGKNKILKNTVNGNLIFKTYQWQTRKRGNLAFFLVARVCQNSSIVSIHKYHFPIDHVYMIMQITEQERELEKTITYVHLLKYFLLYRSNILFMFHKYLELTRLFGMFFPFFGLSPPQDRRPNPSCVVLEINKAARPKVLKDKHHRSKYTCKSYLVIYASKGSSELA
ncbi:hypothetical protein ACJX0J_025584, partial [Zea mays]